MNDHTGILDQAQRYIDQFDPNLAAYVLRDTELAELAGASSLLWTATNHGCVKNDIQPIIDDLRQLNATIQKGECMACGDRCGQDMLSWYGRLGLCPVCAEGFEEEE